MTLYHVSFGLQEIEKLFTPNMNVTNIATSNINQAQEK